MGIQFNKGEELKVLAECPGKMTEEKRGKIDEGGLINGLGGDSGFT